MIWFHHEFKWYLCDLTLPFCMDFLLLISSPSGLGLMQWILWFLVHSQLGTPLKCLCYYYCIGLTWIKFRAPINGASQSNALNSNNEPIMLAFYGCWDLAGAPIKRHQHEWTNHIAFLWVLRFGGSTHKTSFSAVSQSHWLSMGAEDLAGAPVEFKFVEESNWR